MTARGNDGFGRHFSLAKRLAVRLRGAVFLPVFLPPAPPNSTQQRENAGTSWIPREPFARGPGPCPGPV